MRYDDPSQMPLNVRVSHASINAVARLLIGIALALPYEMRVRLMGRVMAHFVGPLAGYSRRARDHVALILPHLPHAEHARIARQSLNNAGRTLIENYSSKAFLARQAHAEIAGPGLGAFEKAAADKRPVILVTGHFGNYEAVRAALVSRGHLVGGLYRDMANPYFNRHYAATMHAYGGPVFPQGRHGTTGFVRHIKAGGQLVLLFDQHVHHGTYLDFLGKPASTATSAAKLALRYDAVLIPFYGIRRADGLNFDCVMESPIAHSEPVAMTQAMNDSISARIRAHPEQWLWTARRWRDPVT